MLRTMHGVIASSSVIAGGWNIANATYNSISFDVSNEVTAPHGIAFKSDGTKMYVLDGFGKKVYQYLLGTAWEVQTASVENVSPAMTFQDSGPTDIYFKSDGTKMYMIGAANGNVNQYSLGTAWEVQTASFDGLAFKFSVTGQETQPTGISFKSDGTKMYVTGVASDNVHQYSLGTAWDLSTATATGVVSFSVAGQEGQPHDVSFKSDGTKMYIAGNDTGDVYQYSLGTAWDLSTATATGVVTFSVAGEDILPTGVTFKSDGTKMYIAGNQFTVVYEYDL